MLNYIKFFLNIVIAILSFMLPVFSAMLMFSGFFAGGGLAIVVLGILFAFFSFLCWKGRAGLNRNMFKLIFIFAINIMFIWLSFYILIDKIDLPMECDSGNPRHWYFCNLINLIYDYAGKYSVIAIFIGFTVFFSCILVKYYKQFFNAGGNPNR